VLALSNSTLSVLAILSAVVVLLAQASLGGWIAQRKGRPFWLYFVAGIIVPFVVPVAALVLLPRRHRLRL
jgi:hypothetical protein